MKDESGSSGGSVLNKGNTSEEGIETDTPDTSNPNEVPEESSENPSDKVEEESVEETEEASEETEERSSPKLNLMRATSVFPLEKGKRHKKSYRIKENVEPYKI